MGGTKTLVAAVKNNGEIITQNKFPTPQDYNEFIKELCDNITNITDQKPDIISMAIPGIIDREAGVIKMLGNLPWKNKPIVANISKNTGINNIVIENDANLAGLSEAHNLDNLNQRVMYVTFSTGVGTGFVVDGILVKELLDAEGGHMIFEHDGKMMDWEEFASGRAIVDKYNKRASELEDPKAWQEIAKNMSIGIVNNSAVFMANTVVIGGSVGTYFDKYGKMLREEVNKLVSLTLMIPSPKIVGAKNAEEAVVLGAIIYARQHEQRT